MDPKSDPRPAFEERNARRPRAQLSCGHCRHKKLKCDRGQPCDQCTKRNQEHLCQYATNAPRDKAGRRLAAPTDFSTRLRELEELVLSLRPDASSNRSSGSGSAEPREGKSTTPEEQIRQATFTPPTEDAARREQFEVDSPGTMVSDQKGTKWVAANHWQAILDGISELKDCTDSIVRVGETPTTTGESLMPTLFAGTNPSISKADILAFLPERPVVDRLISRFFNAKEPGVMTLHVPTFYKEYTQFWENPAEADMAWIGLLCAILCFSTMFYFRVGDTLPGLLGDPLQVNKAFRTKAAECLVLADFTKPGRYKVEALLVYLGTEYILKSDTQLGISMLLGIIVRLAMHMGYHRDSKHYPSVSVFDGEMRRRVWAMLVQMDHLASFQDGLPRLIPLLQCNTELPSNLMDEDFDESSTVLPPPRPLSERTLIGYTLSKSRLISVLGAITEKNYLMASSEHEVVQLDKALQEAHAAMPQWLKIRTINLSITDPPDLIMQRYNLELLYQKARCVLHRKYLIIQPTDVRYAYSRWACVEAGMEILRIQNEIYNETLPGGQLYRDRWYISSLTSHDFLLAAMILCLKLSSNSDDGTQSFNSGTTDTTFNKDKVLECLRNSHRIWSEFSGRSLEARKAAKALAVMLHNTAKKMQLANGVNGTNGHFAADQISRSQDIGSGVGRMAISDGGEIAEMSPEMNLLPQNLTPMSNLDMTPNSGMMGIEGLLEVPEMFDWDAWDTQMHHNTNTELAGGSGNDRPDAPSFEFRWFQPNEYPEVQMGQL